MNLWTNDTQIRKEIATIFQAQLKEIGIKVNIQVMEWGNYIESTARGEHDTFLLGWFSNTGDPDFGLYPLFHSNSFGRAGNRSFYSNKKVDILLDKARQNFNEKERNLLYNEIQDIIQEELPIITFAFPKQNLGFNKKVLNLKLPSTGYYQLYNVDIADDI